jgi:hypothetical protein
MKAINKRHFNPEAMPYQETQIVSRYDYYSNKLSFGEKRIYKKSNGKLVYIMFRTHSIVVPKENLKKQSHYVTQMAKSYFQQDDMMETKQKTVTYCDKIFINQQKELVKQMWNL